MANSDSDSAPSEYSVHQDSYSPRAVMSNREEKSVDLAEPPTKPTNNWKNRRHYQIARRGKTYAPGTFRPNNPTNSWVNSKHQRHNQIVRRGNTYEQRTFRPTRQFISKPGSTRYCEVCNKMPHKYKCPTCRILFCSVECSKKHKEIPCTAPPPVPPPAVDLFGRKKDASFTSNNERNPFLQDNNNRNDDDLDNLFEGEDLTILAGIKLNKDIIDRVRSVDTTFDIDDPNTLKPEQLEKIGQSEKIKRFLKDDKLRDYIGAINAVAMEQNPHNRFNQAEELLDAARERYEKFNEFVEGLLDIVYETEGKERYESVWLTEAMRKALAQ
ncbi:1040_t:CDS:2 [Paraglomus brasilianum]|uniref:1040_t:CDS:1 n=1 Tax=Paraglomus brasilianum TaxID=144538 RepID=A0A9N9CQ72_9GLOM|nr:1040_t:CDS:2 [Paraglomus brasilianum]